MPRNRKLTTLGGAAQSAPVQDPTTYTLPALHERLGPATEKELSPYTHGLSRADLVAEGRRVGTSRIDTDTARLYGIAADFFAKATESQLDALMGVSPRMLRIAVWAAHKGSALAEARDKDGRAGGATKQQLAAAAERTRATAMLRRNSLRRGLRALAAGDAALLEKIDHASGSVTEPRSLGDSLLDLAAIGKQLLKSPSAVVKERLQESRLTTAMLASDEALAQEVRKLGESAVGVVQDSSVAQAEVDYWDGVNLFLLGHLIRVFDAGHDADPTIPRLTPIALRGYFRTSRKLASKDSPEDAPSPAPAPLPA